MTTRSGGDDRTSKNSTELSDGQVVSARTHMKVWVKVWCRFVTTRSGGERIESMAVSSVGSMAKAHTILEGNLQFLI